MSSKRVSNIMRHLVASSGGGEETRILIANRGEIAVRILQSARNLGLGVVVIYAPDDAESLHVKLARKEEKDSAILLQKSVGKSSPYLDMEQIVRIAIEQRCSCIHPGIGYLSENAKFRELCAINKIRFVGPRTEVLEVFSDKDKSRELAVELGIPVTQGRRVRDAREAAEFLEQLQKGSMILKATAGGGGVGMRIVSRIEDVESSFSRCVSESTAAFGSGDILAEQYIPNARHIEIQMVGDGLDGFITLGERECSIQRKHQKLIEIAPSPNLPPELRQKLVNASLAIAQRVRYQGVGTVEFLVDKNFSEFYFMEVNPRLQVEHTVTECTRPGLDLVSVQFHLALFDQTIESLFSNGVIPKTKDPTGFAIQCRINMESMLPDGGVIPASVGNGEKLDVFEIPHGLNVRVETHAYPSYSPPAAGLYDSLLAKVIVFSNNPRHSFANVVKMTQRALADFRVVGVDTNIPFLLGVLNHPLFQEGNATLSFVQEQASNLVTRKVEEELDTDSSTIVSPLQGQIVELTLTSRTIVKRGDLLAVISAMKMEHEIRALRDCVITQVLVTKNQSVNRNQVMFHFESSSSRQENESSAATQNQDGDDGSQSQNMLALQKLGQYVLDANRPQIIEKRHKAGMLTASESVNLLCDQNTTFLEYGRLATRVPASSKHSHDNSSSTQETLRSTTPRDGVITGIGVVNSNRVVVVAYDYTVLAGTQGTMGHIKQDRIFNVALEQKLPLVMFAEGGGGRPGDFGIGSAGLDVPTFKLMAQLSGKVPLLGVVTGRCFAGNAVLAGVCDCIIATKSTSLGMAGPAMIYGGGLGDPKPEEVGPAEMHFRTGVVDILVENDLEAIAVARRYMGYFSHCRQQSQQQFLKRTVEMADQRILRRLIPENRRRSYDVRKVITTLCDTDSVLELRAGYGIGIVTCLARIQGISIGLIANNVEHLSGAIDGDGSDKMAKFLELCNQFQLPIVSLSDTPGFMVGVEAETTALVKRTSRLFIVGASLKVPVLAIILRKSYGLGGMAMSGGGHKSAVFTISWPTGEIGGMGLEGAIRLAFRKQLSAITDLAERERTFEHLVKVAHSRALTLEAVAQFEVDDVIDPAQTRDWILGIFENMFQYSPSS